MSLLNTLTDEEILPELILGRAEAFTVLYERYNRTVYRIIYKFVRSAPLAEDLTQELFIKFWDKRQKLSQIRNVKSFLLTSARNYTLDSLRASLSSEIALGEVVKNFVEQRATTEDRLLDADYEAFLDNELAKLPERSRDIFQLCRKKGHTYDEVAAELGISKSAVKKHMIFSMKVLKSSVELELGVSLVSILVLLLLR